MAKERRLEHILILEDDVVLRHDFVLYCNRISGLIHTMDWDMCYFFYGNTNIVKTISLFVRQITGTVFTHAYAVKMQAYDLLISVLEADDCRPIDVIFELDLFYKHGAVILCTADQLARQCANFSDVQKRVFKKLALTP